jgi:hypothetical protein
VLANGGQERWHKLELWQAVACRVKHAPVRGRLEASIL